MMSAESIGQEYVSKDYEAYTQLTEAYAALSPQHQGLTADEFQAALDDPAVVKTQHKTEAGDTILIPQLSPVERNGWLNADFYERSFPQESSRGDVLFYVDIPGIAPSEHIAARVRSLAENEGVIVFDYPENDPEYLDRVMLMVNRSGVVADEVKVLGNQTYFAGQTHLTRREYPLPPPCSFADTFAIAVADGSYDPARFENGASLQTLIGPEDAQHMLGFYEEAYKVLNDHPCEQGLNPQEFMHMMTEDESVAKIVNKVDGKIVALCLLDNNLEKLSWVNAEYYKNRYPSKTATKQVMWFPGLAADPSSEVGSNTQTMVDLIAELGEKANNDIMVVFDCCDINTGFLDRFLEDMINKTPYATIDMRTIAVQKYCAIKTRLKQ